MSEIKELNVEELEKVSGGENEENPTFSDKVNDIKNYINDELYFIHTYDNGAGLNWYKGLVLSVSYEDECGRQAEKVQIRIIDSKFGINIGYEMKIDTINFEIYKNKN